MKDNGILLTLALKFGLISLMTIGGGFAAIPEMHRVAVDSYGWMSSETFANLFALAQAAPGPNLIIVTLIGWHVAGVPGALVATFAICAPAFVIVFVVSRMWARWNRLPWYRTFERGLVPVTVGLVLASGWLLTASTGTSWMSYVVTAVAAASILWKRVNPIVILAVAGALGLLHVV